MTIPFRPLSDVKMMLEDAGFEVSYAYDDLVFVNHTAYLVQFDDENSSNLKLYFNAEIEEAQALAETKKLQPYAGSRKITLTTAGKFKLEQKADTEEIEILFFPS